MSIKTINSEKLKELIDQNQNITLIDVREKDEWDAGHIENAHFLPLSELETRFSELKDRNAQLIIQCRSGKRSLTAAKFFEEQGYTDLTNLEDGILGWMDFGFDIVE